jgi:hypothetical protein
MKPSAPLLETIVFTGSLSWERLRRTWSRNVPIALPECPLIETLFWRPRSDNGRENQPRRFLRWATLPPSPNEIPLLLRAILVQ